VLILELLERKIEQPEGKEGSAVVENPAEYLEVMDLLYRLQEQLQAETEEYLRKGETPYREGLESLPVRYDNLSDLEASFEGK
jgi:molybdopterin-guanine dinucleotide biosynthesis protein A